MLNSLAERFWHSRLQRHGLFLVSTAITIFMVGYHFGTFDQSIHVPFLKKYADPTLFPNDAFFEMRHQHYSYFWFLFLPSYRLGGLEVTLFVVHLFATYFTFWALWTLSEALFQNPLSSLLSLIAFVIPHLGFAGFSVFEFSLLNRTFVLPFLIWAIIVYLRRRYGLAFLLLGLMYNLHVLSVNFVLAMLLFDCLLERRTIGWRNILGGIGLFMLAALPVLVWRWHLPTSPPVAFDSNPEWFSIISRSIISNLFFLVAPHPYIIFITLSGLSALALFLIGYLASHSRQVVHDSSPDRTIRNFIGAVLVILAVQGVTAQWHPVTIIIQSQIIRAGVFVLIFGYLYFANYLTEIYQSGTTNRFDLGLLAMAFFISPVPIIPVVVWGLQSLIRSVQWRAVITTAVFLSVFAFTLKVILSLNLWAPGVHLFAQRTPWHAAQRWAHDHTPKDAIFITPPHIWWFYESDWRVFSERPTVVTLSELLEVALVPYYTGTWKERFETLAPGALARFTGDFFENKTITAQAFYSLSADDLQRIAQRYGASYLVVEKPHAYRFPVAYENEQFVIYDLR